MCKNTSQRGERGRMEAGMRYFFISVRPKRSCYWTGQYRILHLSLLHFDYCMWGKHVAHKDTDTGRHTTNANTREQNTIMAICHSSHWKQPQANSFWGISFVYCMCPPSKHGLLLWDLLSSAHGDLKSPPAYWDRKTSRQNVQYMFFFTLHKQYTGLHFKVICLSAFHCSFISIFLFVRHSLFLDDENTIVIATWSSTDWAWTDRFGLIYPVATHYKFITHLMGNLKSI